MEKVGVISYDQDLPLIFLHLRSGKINLPRSGEMGLAHAMAGSMSLHFVTGPASGSVAQFQEWVLTGSHPFKLYHTGLIPAPDSDDS